MKQKSIVNYRLGDSSATLKYLEWDSGIFGFKIGRIEKIRLAGSDNVNESLIRRVLEDCRVACYRHINCRVGVNDLAGLRAFENNGFNVADIQITLSTMSRPMAGRTALPGFVFIKASGNDLRQIRKVTRNAFTDTRVVRDPNYPRKKIDEFYYEWVKNSVFNKKQVVFLAKDSRTGVVAGFVICGVLKRTGLIDLISVNRARRGLGIGRALVARAMEWFSDKTDKAEVRTQISNAAAIEVFMKGGYKFITPGSVLPAGISMHYWY